DLDQAMNTVAWRALKRRRHLNTPRAVTMPDGGAEFRAVLQRLRDRGVSGRALADYLSVFEGTVHTYLAEHSIRPRRVVVPVQCAAPVVRRRKGDLSDELKADFYAVMSTDFRRALNSNRTRPPGTKAASLPVDAAIRNHVKRLVSEGQAEKAAIARFLGVL